MIVVARKLLPAVTSMWPAETVATGRLASSCLMLSWPGRGSSRPAPACLPPPSSWMWATSVISRTLTASALSCSNTHLRRILSSQPLTILLLLDKLRLSGTLRHDQTTSRFVKCCHSMISYAMFIEKLGAVSRQAGYEAVVHPRHHSVWLHVVFPRLY